MAGTKQGGQKAAAKNLARNPNHYRDIGRIGGRNGHTGGFAANPALASIAGAKGGRISRRSKMKEAVDEPAKDRLPAQHATGEADTSGTSIAD